MSKRNMSEDSISKGKVPEDISEDKGRRAAGHGSVLRLRGCNIFMLRISVAILIVLCATLFGRIQSLNRTIDALKAQTERLLQMVSQQQETLELLTGQGQGLSDGQQEPIEPLAGESQDSAYGGQESIGNGQEDLTGTGAQGNEFAEVEAAHKVYLTFDDGPSTNTQDILDILDRYGVKATFFVLGKEGSSAKEAMRRIVEEGHTLGMHSWNHEYTEVYASLESFAEDFAMLQEYIYEVTGVTSTVYRFPGGSSNTVSGIDMKEFARYLDSQGVRFFDWNISSQDGSSYLVPVDTLVENCTADIGKYGTSVILLHDAAGKKTTVEALPAIIEAIQAMDGTVLLPITDETVPVQHIEWQEE